MPDTLICTACSAVSDNLEIYSCPKCWGPVTYQRNSSPCLTSCREGLWHYSDLLPSELDPLPGFPVGDTPLLSAPALAERWAVKEVWIKNETANPTHSFKDRVVAVALARARYLGLKTLACTSTGNLGHALAAACAQSGLRCVVLLPDAVEPAKTAAARALGARVIPIQGSYDDVNRVAHLLAEDVDWGFVNMTLRPFYAEGSKTIIWEIIDQLNSADGYRGSAISNSQNLDQLNSLDGYRGSTASRIHQPSSAQLYPTDIVAPLASGSLYSKLYSGAKQIGVAGIRFHGAQPGGCQPIAQAFSDGAEQVKPVKSTSRAQSLAIGTPADGENALKAARASGGKIVSVPEADLPAGVALLGQACGVLTESAGAVTTLGAEALAESGQFPEEARVVLVITGDGLKGLDLVEDASETEEAVKASPEAVLEVLSQ